MNCRSVVMMMSLQKSVVNAIELQSLLDKFERHMAEVVFLLTTYCHYSFFALVKILLCFCAKNIFK